MPKELVPGLIAAAGLSVFVVLLWVVARSKRPIMQLLGELAVQRGWHNMSRHTFFNKSVEGEWSGRSVSISHAPRYKSRPERLVTRIRIETPAPLIMKRRFDGLFSNKPLTFFGPPLVDLPQAQEFWVRTTDRMLVDRVFANSTITSLLRENLIARFDEVRLDARGIGITRALDEKPVKERFGRSGFDWGFHEPTLRAVAEQEWQLATALTSAIAAGASYEPRRTSGSR